MALDKKRSSLRWLVLLQLSVSWIAVGVAQSNAQNQAPYIIYAQDNLLIKMNLDGSNQETLHQGFTIAALDYHYRRNTVYWISETIISFAFLYKLDLNKNPIQAEVLHSFDKSNTGGLAVDWINDKVYWTERNRIMEFDLANNTKTVVATLTGLPAGIGVVPHRDSPVLYFIEKERVIADDTSTVSALVRMTVGEGTQTILIKGSRDLPCPHALTIDYPSQDIYWDSACARKIDAIKVDGTGYRRVYDGNNLVPSHMVSGGIAYYDQSLFWTDTESVFTFNTSANVETPKRLAQGGITMGIKVVHSSQQPTEEQLRVFEECIHAQCVNGECLGEGQLCVCNPGWTGEACDEDIDECEVNNGGCQDLCTNKIGSYECSCREGRILGSNQRNCIDLESPQESTTAPTTSSVPTTTPVSDPTPTPSDPTVKPTTNDVIKPVTDRTQEPTSDDVTKPVTDQIPETNTEQKTKQVTTDQDPGSTTEQETEAVSDQTSHAASTSSTTTVQPITSQQTTTSHDHKMTTVSSGKPTDSSDAMPTEALTDATSQTTKDTTYTRGREDATISTNISSNSTLQVAIPSDGIEAVVPEKSSPNIIIIAVSSATGTIVLVAIVCYVVFLYCKYSRHKKGSYDVQRRHRSCDVESPTTSARNSFRPVSEYHYSPELESRFFHQIMNPGSTTSFSEHSTTSTVPHEQSSRSSSESESGGVSSASESSAESESRPLRVT